MSHLEVFLELDKEGEGNLCCRLDCGIETRCFSCSDVRSKRMKERHYFLKEKTECGDLIGIRGVLKQ